jgi:N-acetylneuraminate lyase
MMMRGILPAAVTPLDENGKFLPAALERLLARLYGAGVHGVYLCGSTGEGMLQPPEQRQAIVETAMACTPRDRTVMVHVGAASLQEALALSAHAARAGAHAISSLPPTSAQFSFADLRRYYEALAGGSDLPLVVYYFPDVAPAIDTAEQLEALCDLPNVIGVKFTDFDLFRMANLARPGRVLFNGRDEVLAAGLLMGAGGGIGTFYNLLPELFVDIYDAAAAGRWEEARAAQRRVNTVIRIALAFPLFPAVKQMLAWSGLDCGLCLPPRAGLDAAQQDRLREALTAAGFDHLAGRPTRV